MKIFDEYANTLKGTYSIRFNGRSDHGALRPAQLTEDPTTGTLQPAQHGGPRLLLSTLSQPGSLTKLGTARRERKRFARFLYQIITSRIRNIKIIRKGFAREIA